VNRSKETHARRIRLSIGFARIVTRSNSFARTCRDLNDFQNHELISGNGILERYRNTGSVIGGVLSALDHHNAPGTPLVATSAPSGGPVHAETLESLATRVIEAIGASDPGLEALVLEMSGASTTTCNQSGEELVIQTIRDRFERLPIVLVIDSCANVTPKLVDGCDCIVSTQLIPSLDRKAAGIAAVEHALNIAESGSAPAVHLEQIPILVPMPAQRMSADPLADLISRIESSTLESGIDVSIFVGYPYADGEHAGASIVAYGDESTVNVASELAAEFRSRRSQIFVKGHNVEEAVHHAMAEKDEIVLIADLGDNPDDGAPGDGTTLLWALMDLGVRNATLASIADPAAVAACFDAGEGVMLELQVGGKRDTRHGYPIDVKARVVSLFEGPVTIQGSIHAGLPLETGRGCVLDVEARHDGHVELILTEQPVQITDLSLFEHAGVDVRTRSIVSIKSTNEYLPAFGHLTSSIYEVITPGITTPDPAFYEFQHVRRPIYPLDDIE
jgi:microcystin degradation protein MlrC